jgi:hypothetical protein
MILKHSYTSVGKLKLSGKRQIYVSIFYKFYNKIDLLILKQFDEGVIFELSSATLASFFDCSVLSIL